MSNDDPEEAGRKRKELEKLDCEITKLRAETASLTHPFRHPSVVGALSATGATALLAIVGFLLQLDTSRRERQLAEIKTESLKLESVKLEGRREDLEATIARRNKDLQAAEQQLVETQRSLSKTKLTQAELERAVGELRMSVEKLRRASVPLAGPLSGLRPNERPVKEPQVISTNAGMPTAVPSLPDVSVEAQTPVQAAVADLIARHPEARKDADIPPGAITRFEPDPNYFKIIRRYSGGFERERTITSMFVVTKDGAVIDPIILGISGDQFSSESARTKEIAELTPYALAGIRTMRFHPARLAGVAVPCLMTLTIRTSY
jgi:hypothetical protein